MLLRQHVSMQNPWISCFSIHLGSRWHRNAPRASGFTAWGPRAGGFTGIFLLWYFALLLQLFSIFLSSFRWLGPLDCIVASTFLRLPKQVRCEVARSFGLSCCPHHIFRFWYLVVWKFLQIFVNFGRNCTRSKRSKNDDSCKKERHFDKHSKTQNNQIHIFLMR